MRSAPRSPLTLATALLSGLISLPAWAGGPEGDSPAERSPSPSGAPTVLSGEGCVEIRVGEACERVAAGNSVPLEVPLTAGQGGLSLAFPSGVAVTLEHGTRLRVLPAVTMNSARGEMAPDQLDVTIGRIQASVPASVAGLPAAQGAVRGAQQRARAGLLVRGPSSLSSIVPAGQAIIKVSEYAMSVGSVSGGKPVLSTGNGWHPVEPGTVKVARRGGALAWRRLPEAPRTFDCTTLAFAGTTLGGPLTVRWHHGSDGARSYEVVLVRQGDGAPAAHATRPGDENEASFSLLPPGNYSARVRGLDLDGFPGPWSLPLALDVVGATLPADARMAGDGSVLIPADEPIELSYAQRLEADVLRLPRPVVSPERVWLTSRMPTLVRLHRPGERESISLRVAPVEVKAAVAFEPAPAAPEPSLEIVVRIYAADGGAVPARVRIRPVALLGGETIELPWRRESGALRALVPLRQATAGGALRVRVMDGSGRQVGAGRWSAERVASR
jgi:hypothetical protein